MVQEADKYVMNGAVADPDGHEVLELDAPECPRCLKYQVCCSCGCEVIGAVVDTVPSEAGVWEVFYSQH